MTKEQVHREIDRLDNEQLSKVLSVLDQLLTDDPRERWRGIPNLRMPEKWPPDYGDFEPVRVQGEPVSEQLIRERR